MVEESKSVSSPRNSDRLKAEAKGGRAKTSTSKVSSVRPKNRGRYLHLLAAEDVVILEDVICLVILLVSLHVAGVTALLVPNELNCWLCKIPTVPSFGTHDVLVFKSNFPEMLATDRCPFRYQDPELPPR